MFFEACKGTYHDKFRLQNLNLYNDFFINYSQVRVAALKFFLGSDPNEKDSDESDSDEPNAKEVMMANKVYSN